MSDSRAAADRLSKRMQSVLDAQKRLIYFLGSLVLAFLTTFLVSKNEVDFTQNQQYVLFILIFAVALWVSEAIPPFATGLLIVGLLIFLLSEVGNNQPGDPNYINVQRFVDTWTNSVIWLMLGGFFIAGALKKTGLDLELFRFSVSRFGDNPQQVLLGVMLVTAVFSMVMSNTATTAMMLAAVMPFIDRVGPERNIAKVLLIGIPAAAAVGGMGTIIGSPPNVIAVDAINNYLQNNDQIDYEVGFLEWMILGVPVALVLVVVFWKALVKKYKIKLEKIDLELGEAQAQSGAMERFERKIVLGVLTVTVLLWVTGNVHGIPAAAISGIPIIILPMVSVITGEDVRELPWDTLMLVAGGLSLGLAIKESGLAEFFVEKIQYFSINQYLLMFTFGVATVLFSNIMSNTATATILIPIASIIPGVEPVTMAIIIGLCASCALLLPVSTPPNAIAFSTGYIKQGDFRMGGVMIGILGPVLAILWVLLLFSFLS
ncbi:MAG: DASS family sodium-coupled anion symporter [Saprospiraceae bacterium]|nr:DASS family sodium-coupled anion symporter [Saprospiraceae bacterium]